jgi:hypothetical protein
MKPLLIPILFFLISSFSFSLVAQTQYEEFSRPMIDNVIDIAFLYDSIERDSITTNTINIASPQSGSYEGGTSINYDNNTNNSDTASNNDTTNDISSDATNNTGTSTFPLLDDCISINLGNGKPDNNNDFDKYTSSGLNSAYNISSNHLSNTISIYPNPSSHYLCIRNFSATNCTLQIFALNGQLILQQDLLNKQQQFVDIQHIANGSYIVKISNKKAYTSQTFQVIGH